jgi:hypothetical protein
MSVNGTATDLIARVVDLQALQAKKRPEQKDAPPSPNIHHLVAATDSALQALPQWPDKVRGIPNIALRSALFGAVKRNRTYLERQEIHAQDGIRIVYTGTRLDQGDLDVWETALHLISKSLSDECRITIYQLLKLLGKTDTGKNREILNCRLSRLKATALDIKVGSYSYEGSLIDDVFRAEDSREYVIRLNTKFRELFKSGYTQIDWLVRHELDGKPLAQWLHGYFSSFASNNEIFPVKIETLHKLCGSEADLRKFKQTLVDALNDLADTCNANHIPFKYEIRDNIVYVERKPGGRVFRGERKVP